MAELLALDQCLEILAEANLQNVIIEADLDLIIRAAKKIHNGTSPDKVSKHWKLLHIFYCIHSHLQNGWPMKVWPIRTGILDMHGSCYLKGNCERTVSSWQPKIGIHGWTTLIERIRETGVRMISPNSSTIWGYGCSLQLCSLLDEWRRFQVRQWHRIDCLGVSGSTGFCWRLHAEGSTRSAGMFLIFCETTNAIP